MKAAFLVYYMRCQEKEATNRQKILSWARTFVLCSGLCIIGVVLQVEFDEDISIPQIVARVKHPHAAPTLSLLPQGAPERIEDHGDSPRR